MLYCLAWMGSTSENPYVTAAIDYFRYKVFQQLIKNSSLLKLLMKGNSKYTKKENKTGLLK